MCFPCHCTDVDLRVRSPRFAASPTSGADAAGQQLAAELMLALTAQRGLLHFMLEWVDLALHVSAAARGEEKRSGNAEGLLGKISQQFFHKIVADMAKSAVSLAHALPYLLSVVGSEA